MIVDFIREYWQYIGIVLVILLELLILIFKRLVLKLKLPASSVSQVIDLVAQAEQIYGAGHGAEKLKYVVETYLSHNNINPVFKIMVSDYIKGVVENILETPQKKG